MTTEKRLVYCVCVCGSVRICLSDDQFAFVYLCANVCKRWTDHKDRSNRKRCRDLQTETEDPPPTHTHAHADTHAHARTHTHTHARTHTHTHTHTHRGTHAQRFHLLLDELVPGFVLNELSVHMDWDVHVLARHPAR